MREMGERGKGDVLKSSSEFRWMDTSFADTFFGANSVDSCFCERLGSSPLVLLISLHVLLLFPSHHDFLHTSCYHALLCAYARPHDIVSYAFIFNVTFSCISLLCITVILSVAVSYRIRI